MPFYTFGVQASYVILLFQKMSSHGNSTWLKEIFLWIETLRVSIDNGWNGDLYLVKPQVSNYGALHVKHKRAHILWPKSIDKQILSSRMWPKCRRIWHSMVHATYPHFHNVWCSFKLSTRFLRSWWYNFMKDTENWNAELSKLFWFL